MKHITVISLILFFSMILPPDSFSQSSNYCQFSGDSGLEMEALPGSNITNSHVEGIINELRPYYLIPPSVQIQIGTSVKQYAVVYKDSHPARFHLLYEEAFFRTIFSNHEAKIAAYIILAHELAHIQLKHVLGEADLEERQHEELQADSLAGEVLAKKGFELNQLESVFRTLQLEHKNTHPSLTVRLTYFRIGFNEASKNFPIWYEDADGDGFGNPVVSRHAISQPEGYVENGSDCYDLNPKAFPGQRNFFLTHRGDGEFDYDCNGINDQEYTIIGRCHWGDYKDTRSYADPPGWQGSIPQCGETGKWLDDCDRRPTKIEETSNRAQKCK